jgi:hypothetical protein
MAEWSIVTTLLDPYVNRYLGPGMFRNCVGGALTGAVIEVRNGLTKCLTGAFWGAFQSVAQHALVYSLGLVIRPAYAWRGAYQKEIHIPCEGADFRKIYSTEQTLSIKI